MSRITISKGSSEAVIGNLGAYVKTLNLDGIRIVKPETDGNQTHGGIAVLMPYTDKIEHGRYTFEGRRFQLQVEDEGHAIHGFAKDVVWTAARKGKRFVTLTSVLEGEGYPGRMEARVTYSISSRTFSTNSSVTNAGRGNCPVVIGFHPYFLGVKWKIRANSEAYRYEVRDRYFPTGEFEPYQLERAGPDVNLDDTFGVEGPVSLQTEDYGLVISRRAMPYLVIYNGEFAEAKSVAIEPYTGITNAFNNGIGLRVLKPGQSFRCGYGITLKKSWGVL